MIFQSVLERQYAKWMKIVQFRLSRSTIFIFSPNLTQKLLNRFSPFFTRRRAISRAIKACICKTIVHFVSEHESKERRRQFWRLQKSPKIIVTSLGLLWNLCQFYNPNIYIYKCWNISKDWFSSCWDIRQFRPILANLQENFHFFPTLTQKLLNRFSLSFHMM